MLCCPVLAQNSFKGMPFITNFSTDDYQGGIQNWDITQDKRGFIYVANNFGLLEFDGNEWRLYDIYNNTKLRSVHVAQDGKIYIGGQSIFGYFEADETGLLKFTPLLDRVPEKFRNFDDVWKIYESPSGIIFGTSVHLFVYKDNQINVLSSRQNFMIPEQSNTRVILTDTEKGIVTIENGKIVVLAEYLKGENIRAVLPYTNNRYLIISYDGKFFLYDEHGIEEWEFAASEFVKNALVNTATILNDGNIALGTQNSGLVILSPNGKITDNFTVNRGLNNRTVNTVYEDGFNNLWVGLNDGISYIERGSAFSHINEDLGLRGIGYAAELHNGNLYLGTSNGLFYASQEALSKGKPFEFVEGSRGHVNNVEVVGNDLLMSHHDGAFIVRENKAYQISDVSGSWKFFSPTNLPDILIEGTYYGFNYYRNQSAQKELIGHVEGFGESSRVIEQDGTGNVWMTHGYKGAYKIRFDEDGIARMNFYNSKNGFPADILINVFKIQGELVFGSQDGIYRYDSELDSFVVHSKLDQLFQEENYVGQLKEDIMGNIYFIADNKIGRLNKNNNNSFQKEVNLFKKVNHLLNDDLQNIHCIDLQNVLIGAKDGFIHFNPTVSKALPEKYHAFIRQVKVEGTTDSLIFGGAHTNSNMSLSVQPESSIPSLPYEWNNIKFTYSTPYFDGLKNEYSYKLEGFNDKWSDWSTFNTKEYTNLREGNYTFQLRAKNIYGKVSEITSYSFDIEAPWYRSIIAYVTYVMIFLAIFGVSLAGLDKKHKKDKLAMELKQKQQLQKKDSELHEVTKKSEQEITSLKTEKLQGEIRHKNKELASATMYIINRNEFIHEIKTSLTNIVKKKNGASTDLNKIIKDIEKNTNEAEDWKQFEVHFDEVHHGFTSKLREEFPDLTPQEIKLSAYLRMNMTTKEIASLMHISPRGVEIGRYRLRKKLGLERSVNLVDFMMNFN